MELKDLKLEVEELEEKIAPYAFDEKTGYMAAIGF